MRLQNYVLYVFLLLLSACDSEQKDAEQSSAKFSAVDQSSQAINLSSKDIWSQTSYPSVKIDMPVKQISASVYYVEGQPGTPTDNEGFISNAAFVVTDEGVVVFDALGSPSLAYLLLSKIRSITSLPIVKVVVSHYHADHIYGLQVFKDLGAQIVAPAGAKDYLNGDTAQKRLVERRESLFPWVNEQTHLVDPDVLVSAHETFKLGKHQFVIKPLGSTHSDGDLMLIVMPDQVLLAGDLMFEGRIPFIAGSDPVHWLKELQELQASYIETIVPGHGPASSAVNEARRFTVNYLLELYEVMQQAVDNLTPFDEAYKAVDWSDYEKYPAFVANRNNAYYFYLYLEQASVTPRK